MVLEYKGNVREDTFFDILHEDGMEIGGVKVDINPITEGKTGCLSEHVGLIEKYLEAKKQETTIKQLSVIEKIKHTKQTSYGAKKRNLIKSNNQER